VHWKKVQIATAFRQPTGDLKMLRRKGYKMLPFIRALPEYDHQDKMQPPRAVFIRRYFD
jgi:hypothetical protein